MGEFRRFAGKYGGFFFAPSGPLWYNGQRIVKERVRVAKAMTQGKEWKSILLFTFPLIAGNLLQQLYNTADSLIVGNFTGEAALSAVGTCSPLTMLFIAVAMGLSTGCSIMVAQFFGGDRMEDVRQSVSTSLILLTAVGLAFSVIGVLVSPALLRGVLKVPDGFFVEANAYFRIYCIGLVFQFVYNIAAAILRALGDSGATLYFLLISSGTNILLDLLFVAGFRWGVSGAAVATVISQALSAVVSVVYLFRRYKALRLTRKEFRVYRDKGILVLKLGLPSTVQQCMVSFSGIALQRLVNVFEITAAYTAAFRLEAFVFIPIQGFNMGLATFTGQNLGAGQVERVKRGLRATLVMGVIVYAVMASVCFFGAPWLIGFFGLNGPSAQIGVQYMRFTAPMFLIFNIYFIVNAVNQGAGDVTFVAVTTLTSICIKVLAAYLLAYVFQAGVASVWICNPIGWGYSVLLSILRYRFGPWRTLGLVKEESEHGA